VTRSRPLILVGLAVLAALGVVVPATPAAARTTTVHISSAWARATPPGAVNGVLYLRIVSRHRDTLLGVDVPADVAQHTELHASMGGNGGDSMPGMPGMTQDGSGMMTMRTLHSVRLPADKQIAFEPGGRHVMLVGLVRSLDAGQRISATLRFAHAPAQTISVSVRNNPP
jgi:periplasmic copper chaperone A